MKWLLALMFLITTVLLVIDKFAFNNATLSNPTIGWFGMAGGAIGCLGMVAAIYSDKNSVDGVTEATSIPQAVYSEESEQEDDACWGID